MSEMNIPGPVLDAVRSELGNGRTSIEGVAGSAPGTVDAGDLTALILSMLGRVVDNAAAVSEGLAAVSDQVTEVEVEFWELDAAQAGTYRPEGFQ